MAYTYKLKVGDSARQVVHTLTLYGRPLDLTDAIVYFVARHVTDPTIYIEREAVVTDATRGKVLFQFSVTETSVPGLYNCEWHILFPDVTRLTVPDDDSLTLEIIKGVRKTGNV